MLSRNITRQLLRELSAPSKPLLHNSSKALFRQSFRVLTTTSSRTASIRPPIPPTVPPSDPNAQAALNNLAQLTPAQISALLSSPPPPLPQPPKPPRSKARRYLLRILIASLITYASYHVTNIFLIETPLTRAFVTEVIGEVEPEDIPFLRQAATVAVIEHWPLVSSMMTILPGQTPEDMRWDNWQAYEDMGDEQRKHHFTASLENMPQVLGIMHRVFRDSWTGEMVVVVSFGMGVSGWPAIVHGGMLATIMDEAMSRLAARKFSAGTAVTAKLHMDYIRPAHPDDVFVVRVNAVLPKLQVGPEGESDEDKLDRKMWVVARMEGTSGEVICESRGLFVVPKNGGVPPLPERF